MPPPQGYNLESSTPQGYQPESFDTPLSPQDEKQFQSWKQKYAPKDSGTDYDLRGAYKAGLTPDPVSGHWPDTYKKPNHPTFSNESQYAKFAPEKAGHWDGPNRDVYVKPGESYDEGSEKAGFNLRTLGIQGRLAVKNAGSGLAMLGGIAGGIPGAAAGAMLGKGVQDLFPSIMGEQSLPSQAADVAGNTIGQGVVPQVVGNLMRFGAKGAAAMLPGAMNLPAVKIAQLINKAKGYIQPESGMMETAAENLRSNIPNLSGKSISAIPETSLNELHNVPYNQADVSATKITPIAKDMLSDITTVRNAKLATGNPTLVRQIAANDLVTRNYSKAADTINPSAILDEIGKRPDVYEEAFGKPALDTFTQLMKTAQDKGVGKSTDLVSWREGRKILYISIPAHAIGVPFGVAESIVLGADAMKKVATNPQLGQMLLQAAKTNASAPEASLLQKAIVNGLRGTTLYIKRADGTKEKFEPSTP